MQEEGKKVFFEQLRETGADVNALYTSVAQDYDQLMKPYKDATYLGLMDLLENHFPDQDNRSSLQIYEVGSGAGKMGEYLAKAGFTYIVGLQPCKAFIDVAEKKGVYKTLKMGFCGTGEMDPEWRDKFDVALSCGAFMKNNAPPSGFDEMVESIKKGGVVAFSVREDEWIELGFKEKADSLEKEGKWKPLKKTIPSNQVAKTYCCFLYEKQ